MQNAGVIGLGNIGGGVAVSLARAGRLAAVYDVVPDKAAALEGVAANAEAPAEVAARCDVVFIAVFDAGQARNALSGPGGLLEAARPGLDLVLLSTVELADYHALRALCLENGVELLDCGVTGGLLAASGGLVSLIGGSDEAVARVRPAAEQFSKAVVHMGPAGCGMAAKIARNVIVYGTWLAEHEGMALAAAAGVSIPRLIEAIDESGAGVGPACRWGRRHRDHGTETFEEARRTLLAATLDKDLSAALSLADRLGVDLPAARL
jgi:3-hydroxyisobutyrate dehydrogenase-like beta-hydroxyacid dehydrogenase